MMTNLSTRTRIILLVVLASLPALGLTMYSAWDQRARAELHARGELQRLATQAAQQQAQLIEGARQTLVAIAQVPAIMHNDAARCSEYLGKLLESSDHLYHSMGIYSADGLLICNAIPWQGKVYSPDRLYVNLARSTGKFAIGEYQIGRVTKLQGINFGYPLLDAEGKVTAIAFIALDLSSFNRIAATVPLPPLGIISVIDRNGTILARQPGREGAIGQKLRVGPVLESVLKGREGVFEATGTDGIRRLFAYASVAGNADGSTALRVMVSLPLAAVFADSHRALTRALVAILVATLVLLVAAWYGAEVFVLSSIRTLLRTAKRVQGGRLSARTGMAGGKDELAQLGRAFDDMATALQKRETDLQRVMNDLQQQAITDPLTGLQNRRFLYQVMPRELSLASRQHTMVAVLLMDIDHFKRVNDTHGHEAGDQVLKDIAKVITGAVRGSDYCFRYGGEEFCVVLPDAAAEGALTRAEAIRAAVESRVVNCLGGKELRVTLSVGIAIYPDHGGTPDALLRAADEALYDAKGAGRNRVAMHFRREA
jgi:diguanylate cyclase (GGDEF)-like protein